MKSIFISVVTILLYNIGLYGLADKMNNALLDAFNNGKSDHLKISLPDGEPSNGWIIT